ncbi:hypothetical protein H0H93_011836 [Arthromyces matolae]|nr:hypothetical protein H0H93_011836 [Arthromyces matolae]
MKPGLLSYTTVAIFFLFLTAMTMASPLPHPPDFVLPTRNKANSPARKALTHVGQHSTQSTSETGPVNLHQSEMTGTESEVEMKKTAMREWISKISPIPLSLIPPKSIQEGRMKMVSERRETLLKFVEDRQDNFEMKLKECQLSILYFQNAIFKDLPPYEGTAHLALRLMVEALKIFLYPVYKKDKPPTAIRDMIITVVPYYQEAYERLRDKPDWEKCNGDFTIEKAKVLLGKVEALLHQPQAEGGSG